MHSELLFEFLVDATPVLAECPDATGREVPATELPFAATNKRERRASWPAERRCRRLTDFCFISGILLGEWREITSSS